MALVQELQVYLSKDRGMICLRHPLVYAVPYFDCDFYNELLNQQYEVKKSAKERALQDKEWHSYVFLHERPWRVEALNRLLDLDLLTESEKRDLLMAVWVDSENIWENQHWWKRQLFPYKGKQVWQSFMHIAEGMPVYRGGTKDGLSWTTDSTKARWFARRWRRNNDLGRVWCGRLSLTGVIATIAVRDEHEVVLDPKTLTELTSYKV